MEKKLPLILMCSGVISACFEGPADTARSRAALTAWDFDVSHSEAEDEALEMALDALGDLSSGVQACLSSEGVSGTTITSECETSPIQVLNTTPYPVVSGSQVGGICYWRCKVEVSSQGIEYKGLYILKELQTPTQTSGGC